MNTMPAQPVKTTIVIRNKGKKVTKVSLLALHNAIEVYDPFQLTFPVWQHVYSKDGCGHNQRDAEAN